MEPWMPPIKPQWLQVRSVWLWHQLGQVLISRELNKPFPRPYHFCPLYLYVFHWSKTGDRDLGAGSWSIENSQEIMHGGVWPCRKLWSTNCSKKSVPSWVFRTPYSLPRAGGCMGEGEELIFFTQFHQKEGSSAVSRPFHSRQGGAH